MNKIPKKYQKHMALVLFGLKTQEELDEDLVRYNVNEIDKLKLEIFENMKSSTIPITYMVSLIPSDDFLKLPNKVIKDEKDFEGLEELINSNPNTVELWKFRKEKEGIIGRFSINSDGSQVIEQIWSTNHRDIEHYDESKKIPLIRASRDGWSVGYSVDTMKEISEEKKENAKRQFVSAVIEIERNREKIELMQELFSKLDVKQLALEYRIDSKGFKFIDWDTSNDKKILANLFSPTILMGKERNEDFERF